MYFIVTPFHPHCQECDTHVDPAVAAATAEDLDTLKRWHGGEIPSMPELSTIAHGVTVERKILAEV